MIARVVDAILGLSGVWAYAAVGGLAFGETAAFVGLVLPGEAAVLLGGVLASQGRVRLVPMLAVAVCTAILGDAVGYAVGRRYGARLLELPGVRRYTGRLDGARTYLRQRGGRAVLLGRWTSVLRALLPGLAGMSRMPFGRFLVSDVASGAAWATMFTLLGYAAGASFHRIERVAGGASLVVLLLAAVGFGLRWTARWVIAHPEQVRNVGDRLVGTPPGRWLSGRYPSQLRWIVRRFDPRVARGLGLTITVIGIVGAGWTVGAITQDVYGHDELTLLDPIVAGWFAAQRSVAGDTAARTVLAAMQLPWCLFVLAAVGAVMAAWRGRSAALLVLSAGAGGWVIAQLLQALLPVPAASTAFPSAPTTVAAAVGVAVGGIVGRGRGWASGARAIAGAAMLTTLVGTAALAVATAALTDVLAGAALGTLWALALLLRWGVRAADPDMTMH